MQHLGGKSDHLTHRIPDKTGLWRKPQIHVQFTIKTAVFSFITWIQIISGLQLPAHLLLNPSYGPGLLCNGTLMPGHFCPSLDHYPVCSNHSRLLLRFRTPGFSCVNKPLMDNCSSRLRVRPTLRPPTRHSSRAELRSVTAACIRCKFSLMAEEFQLRLQTTEHTASWWTSTGPNTQGHMGAGVYPSSQSKSAWTDQDTQESFDCPEDGAVLDSVPSSFSALIWCRLYHIHALGLKVTSQTEKRSASPPCDEIWGDGPYSGHTLRPHPGRRRLWPPQMTA